MSERTYTISLSESERTAFAKILGAFVTKLINAPLQIDSPTSPQASTATTPSLPNPAEPPRASQQAVRDSELSANCSGPMRPHPTALEARDRWATDQNGNPWKATSRGVRAIDVHIWKTVQKDTYLRVTWQNPNGAGYADANCFDGNLWPWLIKKAGETTRLYVTTKGNYTNIVGVCA